LKNYVNKIPLGDNKFAYKQEPAFKVLGEELCERFYSKWTPPSIFYHHRNGGHIAALRKHLDNEHFSKFDISRYFYRISRNKIIRALKTCGFSFLEASEAAAHSVVNSGEGFNLPYGFTQSPLLASLCLNRSQAGEFLRRLDKDICVSVYVDDIIISHKDNPAKLAEVSEKLVERFNETGFPISEQKSAISKGEVTSFNIALSNNFMEITHERMVGFFNQVVEGMHNDDVLGGIYNYVLSVNPTQAAEIRSAIDRAKARRS
tara:strand:- start:118 stop:900 length:783 start_codon:yes stop_codon:yes gene_type:complete